MPGSNDDSVVDSTTSCASEGSDVVAGVGLEGEDASAVLESSRGRSPAMVELGIWSLQGGAVEPGSATAIVVVGLEGVAVTPHFGRVGGLGRGEASQRP